MPVEFPTSPTPSCNSTPSPSEARFYVGLDAGASKTKLLACRPGHSPNISLEGPPANPQRIGLERAAHVLAELVERALTDHPAAHIAAICAGVAGAGRPDDQRIMAQRLRQALEAFRPEHISIVHDAAIALEAAFGGGSGLILIAGTGSVVFARTKSGEMERAGGWGYLLGDEGSGHVVGIRGLQAVAHAIDGGPATQLQTLLAERHDIRTRDALIHQVYQDGWPVQQMAPLVIEAAEQDDAVALGILEEQAEQLARQVEWLIARCDAVDPRLAILGGLTRESRYRTILRRALNRHFPDWTVETPDRPPVVGALRLASRMAA